MIEFLRNFSESVEEFLETPVAAAIGAVFIIAMATLILLLLKHFEKN